MTRRLALLGGVGMVAPAAAQSRKPAPMRFEKQPSTLSEPKSQGAVAGEAAPVPDRGLEGPRAEAAPADRAKLAPSIIQRRLPGRGLASEGSPSVTEDRLFEPAPGARLSVPFSY